MATIDCSASVAGTIAPAGMLPADGGVAQAASVPPPVMLALRWGSDASEAPRQSGGLTFRALLVVARSLVVEVIPVVGFARIRRRRRGRRGSDRCGGDRCGGRSDRFRRCHGRRRNRRSRCNRCGRNGRRRHGSRRRRSGRGRGSRRCRGRRARWARCDRCRTFRTGGSVRAGIVCVGSVWRSPTRLICMLPCGRGLSGRPGLAA